MAAAIERGVAVVAIRSASAIMAALLALSPTSSAPSSSRPSSIVRAAPTSLEFTGYVVDQAHVLTTAERRQLTNQLGRFEREMGHQFAVVTVTSLGGEDIETFTTRLANRWSVGRKDYDDGIVLLVAPNASRIAVGYGLEASLPDTFCQHVMDDVILPEFNRGRIGPGVQAGVTAIIQKLAKARAGPALR